MAEPLTPRDNEGEAARTAGDEHPQIDWAAIEREPEFQELVRARRSFVIPGTIFFLSWYMGFVILTAVAPGFMGERVYQGLTVGYVLALTQFLMVLVLGIMYLRKSEKVFDPLAARVIARYGDDGLRAQDDATRAERASHAATKPETVR
ncbi:MAG: hypothetical protein QOI85_1597 [Chloroflexota bacterium]|jgi:uncharacterized membrane protein (DUF485 family)|nr:hypothetical protein [Chloroflexota bacterium]